MTDIPPQPEEPTTDQLSPMVITREILDQKIADMNKQLNRGFQNLAVLEQQTENLKAQIERIKGAVSILNELKTMIDQPPQTAQDKQEV